MTTAETSTPEQRVAERAVATAARRAAGLRRRAEALLRLAELVESAPELNACYLDEDNQWSQNAFYAWSKEDWQAIARAGLKHGAKVAKDAADDLFEVKLSWPGITFNVLGNRDEVCRKVKVGEETIVEEVPDPEALAAVPTVTRTRVEERFEWKCEPLMADAADPAVA